MAVAQNDQIMQHELTENELWKLVGLAVEYYWQENTAYNCTFIQTKADDISLSSSALSKLKGNTLWDLGAHIPDSTWNEHKALRDQRKPFTDLLCVIPKASANPNSKELSLRIHGHPRFDEQGAFIGYHCIARDVSKQLETQRSLNRFRAAMDMSSDMIYLVDPEALRFIDVNQTACRLRQISKEELLKISPPELIGQDEAEIRERYATLIRDQTTSRFETETTDKDGNVAFFETFSRATEIDGKWVVIAVTRIITDRRHSEMRAQKLQQMYSALSETNAAILRARTPQDLYTNVCNAAIKGGKFNITTVMIPSKDGLYRMAASAGANSPRTKEVIISTDPNSPEGKGLGATALRTGEPCISNDYMADPRVAAWHDIGRRQGIRSAAALPLLTKNTEPSILLINSTVKDTFDEDIVKLLKNMASNIAFAIDDFKNDEARARSEKTLRESEERFRSLTQLSSDFYWEQDTDFRFTKYEGKIVGPSNQEAVDELLGNYIWEHSGITPVSFTWEELKNVVLSRERFRDFEFRFVNSEGVKYYFSLSGEPMFDDNEAFKGYRGISKDVTEKRTISERIQYLATHDNLTGLPNRVAFSELLSSASKLAARNKERAFAILFIDLDRFKLVNDTHGHHVGDALLVEVAKLLRTPLRESDIVARLGGDEFVILLQELVDKEKISRIANTILKSFDEPLYINDRECKVTASIGISVYGVDAIDEETLMKHADVAMYVAKDKGKDNFQFYSRSIHLRTKARIELEINLASAIKRDELHLFYQPKLDLITGEVTGAEALLRWRNPQLGNISPAQFIPVAEENGMILPIGEWVLVNSCQQLNQWSTGLQDRFCLSINLSARQFNDPNLLDTIKQTLDHYKLHPKQLELEITESTVISDPRKAIGILSELQKIGLKIALDDFGTGYSSLGQLKHYPIDTLKIDRAFIKEIPYDKEDKALTTAIISMGKTLGMTVVAEGVETIEQLQFLQENNCDQIQGFYFQKPLPAEEFGKWYNSYAPESVATLARKA
ncbi:MAG: EAL domain-containing protein [Pseudohongiellaceae bacterium]|nr:EAL domain-containing protein [Pseudohongiellaceae bacterium]